MSSQPTNKCKTLTLGNSIKSQLKQLNLLFESTLLRLTITKCFFLIKVRMKERSFSFRKWKVMKYTLINIRDCCFMSISFYKWNLFDIQDKFIISSISSATWVVCSRSLSWYLVSSFTLWVNFNSIWKQWTYFSWLALLTNSYLKNQNKQ